jgi:hypothetical protein
MSERESEFSLGQIKRVASVLPAAREAISDEGMREFANGVTALIALAEAASVFQQQSWSHIETPAARALREALSRFGDA